MNKLLHLTLAALIAAPPWITPAFAQRGGGRGGGGGGGGGRGGGRSAGASAGRPSFNRTPSFTPPQGGRPGGGGGAGWQGGMRPSAPAARPTPGPGAGPGQVNRPSLGNRPTLGGGGPGSPGAGVSPGRPPVAGGPNRPGVNPGRPPIAGPGPNRPGGVNPGRPPLAGGGPGPGRPPGMNPARPPAWGPGGGPGRPPGWGAGRPPAWASRPGWNNHQAWVNGYWHGRNNNWWNNGGAFFTGMAVGGIGAWGLNSAIYSWGYRPFMNPYAVAVQPIIIQQPVVVQQPIVVGQPALPVAAAPAGVYDYSQPLAETAPPDPSVADPAMQTFDAAREAFKAGDYNQALKQTDEALKALPNDAAIHEFRALCFFAMKQYDQAAGVLYAVLSVGPGWDWTTLIGLYPSIDVYTPQLRALEEYGSANPNSAAARFVLGYHYLTQGHTEAAIGEFKDVTLLQPSDKLSAQIVAQLSGSQEPGEPSATAPQTEAAPTAAEPPAATPSVPEGNLVGAWQAAPDAGVSIALTIAADGGFQWNLTQQGQTQPIAGKYTYGNGILTLAQSDDNVMVGKVTWQDDSHFVFQAMGGGPNDPGLTFSK
ncbi:tetratricopeptide repeat protein [Paludisphaera borealis]|nr:tetratricopeptide repeat protein [Paludisphaera borealis]